MMCNLDEAHFGEDVNQDLDQKRNISGLSHNLRNRWKHVDTILESQHNKPYKNIKDEREAKRKVYATFGSKSGVDPRVMWDTKEEYYESFAQDLMRPSAEEVIRQAVRVRQLKEEHKENT